MRSGTTENSECEHIQGDIRTARLGKELDAVFIHDAINLMTSQEDLAKAIETAFAHCRPGGTTFFAPDSTRETFKTETSHGGHDLGSHGMR